MSGNVSFSPSRLPSGFLSILRRQEKPFFDRVSRRRSPIGMGPQRILIHGDRSMESQLRCLLLLLPLDPSKARQPTKPAKKVHLPLSSFLVARFHLFLPLSPLSFSFSLSPPLSAPLSPSLAGIHYQVYWGQSRQKLFASLSLSPPRQRSRRLWLCHAWKKKKGEEKPRFSLEGEIAKERGRMERRRRRYLHWNGRTARSGSVS